MSKLCCSHNSGYIVHYYTSKRTQVKEEGSSKLSLKNQQQNIKQERERVRELQHTYIPATSALPKIAHVVQGYL
jgi:hypothetical protein